MTDDEAYTTREGEDDVLTQKAVEEEREREEAFNAVYEWDGEVFDGFSPSKKDVWRALCFKAGFPPIEACEKDKVLFIMHAKAAVWVCLQSKEYLRKLRGAGMDKMLEAFEEWKDDVLAAHTDEETKMYHLGFRLYHDSNVNQAEAVPSGSSGK